MLVSPILVTNEADKKQEYKQLLSLRPKIIPSMKEKRKTQALAKLLLLHSNVKKAKNWRHILSHRCMFSDMFSNKFSKILVKCGALVYLMCSRVTQHTPIKAQSLWRHFFENHDNKKQTGLQNSTISSPKVLRLKDFAVSSSILVHRGSENKTNSLVRELVDPEEMKIRQSYGKLTLRKKCPNTDQK